MARDFMATLLSETILNQFFKNSAYLFILNLNWRRKSVDYYSGLLKILLLTVICTFNTQILRCSPSICCTYSFSLSLSPSSLSCPPLTLSQSVTAALLSLKMVYPRRNLPAEQWRSAQLLSLLSAPAAMMDPACCDTVSPPSRYLSFCI